MATARPFAYNPGASIPGTEQVGSIAYGKPTGGFGETGLEWWNGPDEDLGYVIACAVPGDTQPSPVPGVQASIGFFRSTALTEGSFINLANFIAGPSGGGPFASGNAAKTWLNNNGYWTSFAGSTGATGGTGSFYITVTQNGPNVVMSGSGSFNLTDLTFATGGMLGGSGIGPQTATFISGPNGQFDQYGGSITAPANFGSGAGGASNSQTGSIFGIIVNATPPYFLVVPDNYVSGTTISGTQTFNSTTIAALGMTEGTYNWTWGSGANADGITMVIGGTGSTGATGGTGAGWLFYSPQGTITVGPPVSDGNAIFMDQTAPPTSTYNPNKSSGVDILFFNLNDSAGVDYTSQFTNLQNSGGTISMSQGSNTATYFLPTSNIAFVDVGQGYVQIQTGPATQTVNASAPFVSGTPITLSFS